MTSNHHYETSSPSPSKKMTDNGETSNNNKSWFTMSYEERWSPSSLEQVASLWNLDPVKDIPDLLQLKENLSDLKDYKLNDPLEVARCYYDAHFKLTVAEDKFRKTVAWRQQEGVDGLLSCSPAPQYVHTYYPSCFLEGVDKDGDPIWVDGTGSSDVWPLVQHYGAVNFRNYTLWVRENGLRGDFGKDYERRFGHPPARVTAIIDMGGLCGRHLQAGLISTLEEGIRIVQDYYGGVAKTIVIARAPFVFRVVWSIAQHFCSDNFKKIIVFCNAKNTQATLDKYMDRQVLPPSLGGQGRPGVGFERSGNMEGGILPPEVLLSNPPPSSTPELKLSASGSDTVVSNCDSFSIDGSSIAGSPPPSPVSSLRYSNHNTFTIPEATTVTYNDHAEAAPVVAVKTTSLLRGYMAEGDDRVLLEF